MTTSAFAAEVFYLGGAGAGVPADAGPKVSGTFTQEVAWNDVAGNTSKSFLERGTDYNSELNLNLQKNLPRQYQFEGQWFLRKTDNRRIEPRRDVRLKQMNVKAYNQANLLEFGDFYGDFSQFVLGASLEGLNAEVAPSSGQAYKMIAGRTARPDVTTEKYQRNVFGAQAEYKLFPESAVFSNFLVGVQAATSQDDSATVNRSGNTRDLRNTVVSVHGDMALRKYLAFLYEVARSDYIEDEDASNDTRSGTAVRLMPSLRWGRFNVKHLFQRAAPEFYTEVGSAAADKQQYQTTLDYRFSDRHSLSFTENYHYDHLEGSSRTKRTFNDEKYLVWQARPFAGRPDLTFRPYANYQLRRSDDAGNSAAGITRTAGFSLNDSLDQSTSAGISYEFREFSDRANRSSSEYSHRIGLNCAREDMLFNRRIYVDLSPSLELRRTKTDNDKDASITVGFNAQYDLASRLKMRCGNTVADVDGSQPATDYFNNRAFWEFDYALTGDQRSHFVVRGERNNYMSENGAQSYKEQRVIGKVQIAF